MAAVSLEDIIESRKTTLTAAEVAELLNVSKRLVYQLVSVGDIPHFRVGAA
jgi:excisionase family DNA binding protein